MALILNIDTATEYASLALSREDAVLASNVNNEIRDHASWIHTAIQQLMNDAGYTLSQLHAIAVTAGPGSYTGLRVGMATAKGLCYVLNIPLITENTLKVMAYSATKAHAYAGAQSQSNNLETGSGKALYVPMIDARRMEVYTAIYNQQLQQIMPPVALVLDPASFDGVKGGPLVCFGSGSSKFQPLAKDGRFEFIDVSCDAGSLAKLSYQRYIRNEFADLAYAEPLYLKEFYSPAKK
jgi:tRNA threonylcarbamoyladenosine biosynthesis protein TsaB